MSTTIGSPQLARKGGGVGRLLTGELVSAGARLLGCVRAPDASTARDSTGMAVSRSSIERGIRTPTAGSVGWSGPSSGVRCRSNRSNSMSAPSATSSGMTGHDEDNRWATYVRSSTGRSVLTRVSSSQSAYSSCVQPLSSQSMRDTSGLASVQMISPARSTSTRSGPRAAIHCAA